VPECRHTCRSSNPIVGTYRMLVLGTHSAASLEWDTENHLPAGRISHRTDSDGRTSRCSLQGTHLDLYMYKVPCSYAGRIPYLCNLVRLFHILPSPVHMALGIGQRCTVYYHRNTSFRLLYHKASHSHNLLRRRDSAPCIVCRLDRFHWRLLDHKYAGTNMHIPGRYIPGSILTSL